MTVRKDYAVEEIIPPILAVDFDGTLVENKYPEIGEIRKNIWKAVKAYQDAGWRIILWTCRTEAMLEDAVNFCKENGLVPDEVNRNIPEVQKLYGGDTRKVFASMYIDDRSAVLYGEEGFAPVSIEEYC